MITSPPKRGRRVSPTITEPSALTAVAFEYDVPAKPRPTIPVSSVQRKASGLLLAFVADPTMVVPSREIALPHDSTKGTPGNVPNETSPVSCVHRNAGL